MASAENPVQLLVILFHKKVRSLYPAKWIRKSISSMLNQTFTRFDIMECEYDSEKEGSLQPLVEFESARWSKTQHRWHYEHYPCVNHADAMNRCIDYAVSTRSSSQHPYLAIANVNLDDYYHPDRLQKQWDALLAGADLVSSYFYHVWDQSDQADVSKDCIIHRVDPPIKTRPQLEERMKIENVIAHPVVMMNLSIWRKYPRLYYLSHELPQEDYLLWKRMLEHPDIHFVILSDYLLYYRRHGKQISRKQK